MVCGFVDTHCCHLGEAGVCSHLRDDGPLTVARRWVCTLREQLGSWQKVYTDPRYLRDVRPELDKLPYPLEGCGAWPPPGIGCNDCGTKP